MSRAKGSVGVCQFRRDNRIYQPLEVFSGDSPANAKLRAKRHGRRGRLIRVYEGDPSILAVSRTPLAAPEPIGLDMDDFSVEEPRRVATDLEDFAFPIHQSVSETAIWEREMLSDASSRVSEGQLDDQQCLGGGGAGTIRRL